MRPDDEEASHSRKKVIKRIEFRVEEYRGKEANRKENIIHSQSSSKRHEQKPNFGLKNRRREHKLKQ